MFARLFALAAVATAFQPSRSRSARVVSVGGVRQWTAPPTKYVLTANAPPHGKEGDVIEVTRGFALNYLTPRNLGKPASQEVIAEAEAKKAAIAAEIAVAKEAAQKVAGNIMQNGGMYTIARVAGENGMFGSVAVTDVLQVVAEAAGEKLEGVKVTLPDIDSFGDYTVSMKLFDGVSVDITLSIKEA